MKIILEIKNAEKSPTFRSTRYDKWGLIFQQVFTVEDSWLFIRHNKYTWYEKLN